jgi:hypothetical protein
MALGKRETDTRGLLSWRISSTREISSVEAHILILDADCDCDVTCIGKKG